MANSNGGWNSWEEFRQAARKWYGAYREYSGEWLQHAERRTQGRDEPARNYITCLIAMLNRLNPPPSMEFQLDLLHRNLRPEVRMIVRKKDCRTIEDFLEQATEAELAVEGLKTYHSPPPPEKSPWPEVAYRPIAERRTKVKAASVEAPPTSTASGLQEMAGVEKILRVLSQIQAKMDEGKGNPSSGMSSTREQGSRNRTDSGRSGPSRVSDDRRRFSPTRRPPWRRGKSSPKKKTSPEKRAEDVNKPNVMRSPSRRKSPSGPVKCSRCGELGYYLSNCPNCSGNGKRGG